MLTERNVRYGGVAIAVAGIAIDVGWHATIGLFVVVVGLLVSAWSRTIV